MPARSRAQRRLMAIAEHAPESVFPENKGVLKMSKNQLSDFASTPETGLPARKRKGAAPESINRFMQRRGTSKGRVR